MVARGVVAWVGEQAMEGHEGHADDWVDIIMQESFPTVNSRSVTTTRGPMGILQSGGAML